MLDQTWTLYLFQSLFQLVELVTIKLRYEQLAKDETRKPLKTKRKELEENLKDPKPTSDDALSLRRTKTKLEYRRKK